MNGIDDSHAAWRAFAGTAAGYLLLLLVMFALLFLLPYLIFAFR